MKGEQQDGRGRRLQSRSTMTGVARASFEADQRLSLPYELGLLLGREREIATIVYRKRAVVADEVRSQLSRSITSPAVRSMLNRLVTKGVLKRVLSGNAYVYLAALNRSESRNAALRQFADDYFYGSLQQAAETMRKLLGAS